MRSRPQVVLDGRALLVYTAENMMGVTNYRPKKVGVGTGRNVPEGERRPAGSHPF